MYMIKIGPSYLTPAGDLSSAQSDALRIPDRPNLLPLVIAGDFGDIRIRAVRLTPRQSDGRDIDPRD